MSKPLFPEVVVSMIGKDANAFMILGRCRRLAKKAGVPTESIDAFTNEAMSGDYNNLLQTVMKYFAVPKD